MKVEDGIMTKVPIAKCMVWLVLVAGIANAEAEPLTTDARIAELKNAFEEITESFRERIREQEQKAEVQRQELLTERDLALKARDASDEKSAQLAEQIADLKAQLAARDAELETLRALHSGSDAVIEQKDEEIARLQQALAASEASNARERFALAYNLGTIYKAARQYARAEEYFLKALEMNADDPALHYNLGILYEDNLQKRKKARHHYERFLELAPNDPDAPNVVAWLKEL